LICETDKKIIKEKKEKLEFNKGLPLFQKSPKKWPDSQLTGIFPINSKYANANCNSTAMIVDILGPPGIDI